MQGTDCLRKTQTTYVCTTQRKPFSQVKPNYIQCQNTGKIQRNPYARIWRKPTQEKLRLNLFPEYGQPHLQAVQSSGKCQTVTNAAKS